MLTQPALQEIDPLEAKLPELVRQRDKSGVDRQTFATGTRTRGLCRDSSFRDVAHYQSSRRL